MKQPKNKRASTLVVTGRAGTLVQDAASNQRLLDIAARTDAREGIRQGLAEAKAGQGIDADVFFAEFEARHGITD
jgi:hypothetical protein